MIDLSDLLQATGGRLHGQAHATQFDDFCFDSRQAAPGQLFVAVRTAWGDGHDYIEDACRAGARGVLCERAADLQEQGVTCIVVEDTQAALADWAGFILRKQGLDVIGITGSAGKTTTKEAVARVLGTVLPVFRNAANYSGRFGLPIALGRLQPEHRLAVLEMACDSPGEMAELVRLAMPRCGILLSISQAHLETFGTVENVAAEKARLIESLPANGWAVLNADDPLVARMVASTPARVLTIGRGPDAHVRAEDVRSDAEGLRFALRVGGRSVEVTCGLLGEHNVYPALAAAAMGRIYGLDLPQIAAALRGLQPLPGRLRPLTGRGGTLLLDDTFSSTPAALDAALGFLATLPQRPRMAVLGDMTQLGTYEEQAHRDAGRRAAAAADVLVTHGERMRLAAQEALRQGMPDECVHVTYTIEDALRAVEPHLVAGAVVLVKASAESRLEEVVQGLLPDPTQAGDLLARQSPGWRAVRRKRLLRPTWVEVDLEAIAHNVRLLRALIGPGVRLMAVLKADGYGHGAIKTARTALNNGASWLGVACLSEALALREAGIEAPILVLGYTPPWQAREMVENDVSATVFSEESAQTLSKAGLEMGTPARVHVKADTGMGRLGILPGEVKPFLAALRELPGLEVEGLFTHFATADSADDGYARRQLSLFEGVLLELEAEGLRPPLIHAANSGATLSLPEARFDMVRAGIALFGLSPSSEVCCPNGFRQALAFKTQVAQVKELPAGSCISYGCTYRTPSDSRIAVIPVGYADGFRRAPQHWGEVLVRGRRAPIVGRVCMDQTMIDVTHIPGVRQGDEVVLIGTQGAECITADDVAARLGTINYEVVSEILARVPRVS